MMFETRLLFARIARLVATCFLVLAGASALFLWGPLSALLDAGRRIARVIEVVFVESTIIFLFALLSSIDRSGLGCAPDLGKDSDLIASLDAAVTRMMHFWSRSSLLLLLLGLLVWCIEMALFTSECSGVLWMQMRLVLGNIQVATTSFGVIGAVFCLSFWIEHKRLQSS
jgi:hypothetical protein